MSAPRSRAPVNGLLIAACLLLTACAPAVTLKGHESAASGENARDVDEAFRPQRIALLIGIDTFQDAAWQPLRYAAKDARDMAAALGDPAVGRFDRVDVLTAPADTTRARILAAVDALAQKNLSSDDTVVLYISSHGTLDQTAGQGLHQYVVASDSRMNDIERTAIGLAELKERFHRLTSKRKVLVFAFCHSGQGKSQLSDAMSRELRQLKAPFFVKPIETASEATMVLTASAWGETAREDPALQNDVYTHFLIKAIQGEDRNGDGAVTVSEAHDYAREQTYYYTRGAQRPSMESVVLGADPIILSGRVMRRGKPVLYDYSRDYEGVEVVVDGTNKGMLPAGVVLEPGRHQVVIREQAGAAPIFEGTVTLRTGQQLSLPVLMHGYEQGLAVRVGYQAFLTGKANDQVAKPLVIYGLSYTSYALAPRLGIRGDFSYGQDGQTLNGNGGSVPAEVTQVGYGVAILYRYPGRWAAWYAGPRVGGLYLVRDVNVGSVGRETVHTVTPGGLVGLTLQYRQRFSLGLEGAVNYANIGIDNTTNTVYYNAFGNLAINF